MRAFKIIPLKTHTQCSSITERDGELSSPKLIRVLDFMEATSVTGPAKNLIEFARRAAAPRQSTSKAKVTVATFCRNKSSASNEFIAACRDAGLEVQIIWERFPFDPAVLPAIQKLMQAQDPDIVQTHAVKSHFLMRLTTMRRERHWIAFHHGYTWTNMKVRAYNQLDRWSLASASRVVTVCRPFATALEEMGVRRDRIVIQHNTVKKFQPARKEQVCELRKTLGIPEAAQIVLTVGRLSREKGHEDLIKAIGLLRESDTQYRIKVILVGKGPEDQRLRNVARDLGVADWVLFVGHVADVAPYYTTADLVVLPSHTEGSPNALFEAMAAGLPIVATAVGGVPEIVANNKEALLVEKHNPLALACAIERVLGDVNLQRRMSGHARSAAAAYSPTAYCDSMLALYNSCLAKYFE